MKNTMKKSVNLPMTAGVISLSVVLVACCCWSALGQEVPVRTLDLLPTPANRRNSEGAFVTLKEGRVLFVYTHFTGGGGDHSAAHLAGRTSSDGGRTWTKEDQLIVKNEGGLNVMSVSLLRLQSGEIALFYLLKNSKQDCRPAMRLSTDEGATWGEPVMCITDEVGYYVLNNDRAIQLKDGRMVLPVCLHWPQGAQEADWQGTLMCYLSDDNGKSWRRSKTAQKTFDAAGKRVTTQEPGVVELQDGRVMMFTRASGGYQYLSYSSDGGDTWSVPVPSEIRSPVSPASIKRLPTTGDLLLVWNDHDGVPASLTRRRVPLSTAISKDDGKTWQCVKVLEGNMWGHYCYIAVQPVDNAVLLGYCAMSGLCHTRVTRVPVAWLYSPLQLEKVKPEPLLFDKAAMGPFERLETRLGVWTAETGHAEVHSSRQSRGIKGVRLQGGVDRQVTLTLPQPVSSSLLSSFAIERFAAGTPYVFTAEALTDAGWRIVYEQGEDTPTGQSYYIKVQAQAPRASQFRFRCTSALGAIIGPSVDFHGYFKD
ncbi:MAG: sialidase family protein [Kiritimatiellia bacterium]